MALRLSRLTTLETDKITAEMKAVMLDIEENSVLINDDVAVYSVMKNETLVLIKAHGQPRRTRIEEVVDEIEEVELEESNGSIPNKELNNKKKGEELHEFIDGDMRTDLLNNFAENTITMGREQNVERSPIDVQTHIDTNFRFFSNY